ncbi:MAG: sulfite exporter TauE/SafE family protein [Pseudomonadota bacterium]
MELWQLAILSGTGLIAGFLNVMAGGGSLLTVPIMVFMGVPGPVANGTNRIAILAQNIAAVTAFFRRGHADFRLSLSLAACALPGAVAGALLGVTLDGVWFNRVLALIMVGVLLVMALGGDRKRTGRSAAPGRRQLLWGHLCMVGVGLYGGFIQLGVGFIIMPVLHRVMGLDLVSTNMHKVFIVMTYTIVALIIFANQIDILWIAGVSMAIGNATGAWIAAHVQIEKGEGVINGVLNTVLVLFIVKLLFFP